MLLRRKRGKRAPRTSWPTQLWAAWGAVPLVETLCTEPLLESVKYTRTLPSLWAQRWAMVGRRRARTETMSAWVGSSGNRGWRGGLGGAGEVGRSAGVGTAATASEPHVSR